MDVFGKVRTPEYTLTLEEFESQLFCHIEMKQWSPSVYKKMLQDLVKIREAVDSPLFCSINKNEEFKVKLAQMFGFTPIAQTDTTYMMRLV